MNIWMLIAICVVCATISRVSCRKIRHKDNGENNRGDTQMIQEIHRGLQRMEGRIEALETLIMDQPAHSARNEFD